VKSLRFLIDVGDGTLRRLCTLGFTKRDASLYVAPASATGAYRCGVDGFAEGELQRNDVGADRPERDASTGLPHLSLHESGQAHVTDGRERIGPVKVPPLSEWEGRHALTVTVGTVSKLKVLDGPPRTSQSNADFILDSKKGALASMRLVLFLNGREPSFGDNCQATATLARPHLATPLYVGIRSVEQKPIGDDGSVTIIGGWDPVIATMGAAVSFLWVSAS
jgi:hypothetical protein